VTPPERSRRFAKQAENCPSASEFFSARKTSAQRRVPAGQEAGAPFSAYSFMAQKKSRASGGGATPRC